MDYWLDWARGPAFLFCFSFAVFGLIRHVILTVWEATRVFVRAGDKAIPYRNLAKATIRWLFPYDKMGDRLAYSLTSLVFHVALIVVPVFLAGHIILFRRAIGLSWPAIPWWLADILTVIGVVTAIALVVQRAFARDTREISRFSDYALPLVVALPLVFGFLVSHPTLIGIPYEVALFAHVMTANLVFVLIPITKLCHMVLMPSAQLVAEMAWHWPPNGGSRVALDLGKGEEPV